jgi:hypothetical protein
MDRCIYGKGWERVPRALKCRREEEGVMVWNERIWDTISCHIKGDDIRAA